MSGVDERLESAPRVRTMAELARLAGVSTATVSRALNGRPGIPPTTSRRIQELAWRHGYEIDSRARNLRTGRTSTVAAILPRSAGSARSMSDPFYLEILGGISDELSRHGYDLLITQRGAVGGEYARYVRERRADGLLILERDSAGEGTRELQRCGLPFVAWGPHLPGQDYLSVGGDSSEGAGLAARHLLASGRARPAFVGGERSMVETGLRLRGFSEVLARAGVALPPELVRFTDYTPVQAKRAVEEIVERDPQVDAIFLCSDYMAVAAIEALRGRGRFVPEDVAVVGYDDLQLALYSQPRLTTVRQEIYEGGRLMARKLLELLTGGAPEGEMLPVRLVVRDSAPVRAPTGE